MRDEHDPHVEALFEWEGVDFDGEVAGYEYAVQAVPLGGAAKPAPKGKDEPAPVPAVPEPGPQAEDKGDADQAPPPS